MFKKEWEKTVLAHDNKTKADMQLGGRIFALMFISNLDSHSSCFLSNKRQFLIDLIYYQIIIN